MQIYGYVLITPFIPRTRRQLRAVLGSDWGESERIIRLSDLKIANLLQSCRTVHDEAFMIFYRSNICDFEMGTQGPFPVTFRQDALTLMINTSLGSSFDWFPGLDEHESETDHKRDIDLGVATYVYAIIEQSPPSAKPHVSSSHLGTIRIPIGDARVASEWCESADQAHHPP